MNCSTITFGWGTWSWRFQPSEHGNLPASMKCVETQFQPVIAMVVSICHEEPLNVFFFSEITILCFFGVPGGISAKSGLVVNLKQPTKQSLMTITLAIIKTRFDRLDWKIGKQKTEEIDQRETRKHVPVVHMFFLCFPLCFFWHCFLEPFVHSFIRSFVHSFRSIPFHSISFRFTSFRSFIHLAFPFFTSVKATLRFKFY